MRTQKKTRVGVTGLVFHGIPVCLSWGLAYRGLVLFLQQHLGYKAIFSLTGWPSPADSKCWFPSARWHHCGFIIGFRQDSWLQVTTTQVNLF